MSKQQTAIEWLVEQFNLQAYIPHIEQAKKMEDNYAIEFAEWILKKYNGIKPPKELLEIFKKEKGL